MTEQVALREGDWHGLVNQMTPVQRLVHLAWRQVDADIKQWRDQLFGVVREAYAETIRQEIAAIGCPPPARVVVREGAELRAIAQHAQKIAEGVVNTFNYDLAAEILSIGEDYKQANRNVYTSRLYKWESARAKYKYAQISGTETSWGINSAKEAFHSYNAALRAQAEVVPKDTKCPICAGYVARNPYRSMADLYRQCQLPAHPNCPHHGVAIMDRALSRDECRELWKG